MGLSKRIDEARSAWQNNDTRAAARAHSPSRIAASAGEPHTGTGSRYIGEFAGQRWLRSGTEMLLVGGLAAGVAYGVGALLRGLGVQG